MHLLVVRERIAQKLINMVNTRQELSVPDKMFLLFFFTGDSDNKEENKEEEDGDDLPTDKYGNLISYLTKI